MLNRRLLILAAVAAGMAAWAPAARAAWSAPVTVSARHSEVFDLQLASGPSADLLAWKYGDFIASKGIFGPPGPRYAVAAPGGAFGPERRLPRSYASGPLVDLGGGHLAQLIFIPNRRGANTPEVALGLTNGRFGAPLRICASTYLGASALAGNARGELVFAWSAIASDRSGNHGIVWASVRPAGGQFGRPQILSRSANTEHLTPVTAAVGANGEAVVAFASRPGRMLASVKRHNQRWGAAQNLGPAAIDTENDMTASVPSDGRVIVAWYHTQLCEGGCVSPGYTEVAVQPPHRNRFRPAQLLERDPIGAAGAPSGRSLAPAVSARGTMIAFLASRRATAGATTTPSVVRVAYSHGTRFGAPETISPPNEQASDLTVATGASGEMLTWIRDDPRSPYGTAFAAVRLPNTGFFPRFAPPEQVSPAEHVSSVLATFNIASHWPQNSIAPWTVAWVSRLGMEGPEGPAGAIVRVSKPICPIPRSMPATPPAPDPACVGPN